MKRRELASLVGSLLLVLAGCSGPSVTSSDSSGIGDQPIRSAKEDIQQKKIQTLAAGTIIRASLQDSLATDKNKPGDAFTMKVVDDVKINHQIVVPMGSTIRGTVAECQRSGRVKGRAYMSVRFSELVLPNGRTYPIEASGASRLAPTTKKRDVLMIGGGSGVGTAIGAIAGGGKGAVIGAAAGGAAGTGAVLATRGKETGFPSGTTLSVKLARPLSLQQS